MEPWTVAEAKARFSDLVEKAKSQGPQTITRHGKFAAVLVSAEEWQRRSQHSGSLVEFLSKSPLAASGLKVERSLDRPRKIGL
jgi:prevent-host-death family protein